MVEIVASSKREIRFRAYELLRQLDLQTAAAMSQVAYGHLSGAEWDGLCIEHRKAFEDWMTFAAKMSVADDIT